jgi:hypothetical protein
MPTSQARTFDELEMPWTYDADVGPIVASSIAGQGDGKFMYVVDPKCSQRVIVQLNPHPTSEDEFARRRRESLVHILRLVEQKRVCALNVPNECDSDSSEDDYICNTPQDSRVCNKAISPVIHKTAVKRVRDSDEQALVSAGFTIEQRPRTNGGRIDLTIVAPDGKRFRSKSSAYTYMRECGVE